MEEYNLTRYIQNAFKALSENSVRSIDISDRDILAQMFSLPYPESFSIYFKRAIEHMEEFSHVKSDDMWEADNIYAELGKKQQNNGGPETWSKYKDRWRKYLTGEIKQPRRKQLLEFCVVLNLGEEETYKVLAQFDGAGINYRNPEELLAIYCISQKAEGESLKHYYWLKKQYESRKKKYKRELENGRASETKFYTIKVKSILDESMNCKTWENDEKLLEFMVKNCDELTDGSSKSDENQYSVTNAENLLQMLRYIYVLCKMTPNKEEGYSSKVSGLMSYVNYEKRSWYADLIELVGEGAIHVEKRRSGKETPQQVYDYLDGLRSHIYNVENRMKSNKKNVDPVTRDDVLFFTLMLIVGYMYFGSEEKKIKPEDLPKKSKEIDLDGIFTVKVDTLISELYDDVAFMDWMENHSDITVKNRFRLAVKYCNKFLDLFGFLRVYPPNAMDRLVITCLLSEYPWETLCYVCNPEYNRES